MKASILLFAVFIVGCGQRFHIASPTFEKAPELTCVIFIQSDKLSDELAKTIATVCRDNVKTVMEPKALKP
jgi:hypothetical protein